MRLPFKVSTTTSNFMIGVTAAASAGVYLSRGYIDPGLAMPVMLGVLTGSIIGARVLGAARTSLAAPRLRRRDRRAGAGDDLQRPDGEALGEAGRPTATATWTRCSRWPCAAACCSPPPSWSWAPRSTSPATASSLPSYRVFRGEPAELRSPGRIWATARLLTGRGIIQFGLLVLIGTPIARVLLSVIGFVRERDWMYVLVTAIVFVLLTYSLVAG